MLRSRTYSWHQSGYLRFTWVCHPPARIHVRLLGPCFKTGRLDTFCQHPEECGSRTNPRLGHPSVSSVAREAWPGCSSPGVVPPGQPMLTSPEWIRMPGKNPNNMTPGAPTASNRFPLNNFKHFLTLFSKFFSSFPRGTCSLSVSRRYLALDGIYHRLWAAFPNNPTRGERLVGWRALGAHGVLTLSDAPFQGTWTRAATEAASIDYNSPAGGWRFSLWALPGSLAVTRGILVSFSSSAY